MCHETRRGNLWTRVLTGLVAALAVTALGIRMTEAAAADCDKAKAPPAKPAGSAPAQKAPATSAKTSSAETTGQAGVRAFVDPVTGQLREPTPEEAAALTRFLVRALAIPTSPQVVQHPNGMLSAELGEDYMTDVVVRRNPDGTLSWVCVPHPLNESVLTAPAPPKSPELEKE